MHHLFMKISWNAAPKHKSQYHQYSFCFRLNQWLSKTKNMAEGEPFVIVVVVVVVIIY